MSAELETHILNLVMPHVMRDALDGYGPISEIRDEYKIKVQGRKNGNMGAEIINNGQSQEKRTLRDLGAILTRYDIRATLPSNNVQPRDETQRRVDVNNLVGNILVGSNINPNKNVQEFGQEYSVVKTAIEEIIESEKLGSGTGDNIDVPLSVSPSTVVGVMKHPLAKDLSGYLNIPAGQGVFGGSRMGRMDGGNSEKQPLNATDTSLAGGGSRTLGGGETRKQAPANHGLRNRVLTWLGIGGAAATAAVGGAAAAGSGALGPEAKQAYNDVFGVPTTVTVEAPTQPAVTENPDGSVTATQGGVETTISPATETPAPTESALPDGAIARENFTEGRRIFDKLGIISLEEVPDEILIPDTQDQIGGVSVEEYKENQKNIKKGISGFFNGFKKDDKSSWIEVLIPSADGKYYIVVKSLMSVPGYHFDTQEGEKGVTYWDIQIDPETGKAVQSSDMNGDASQLNQEIQIGDQIILVVQTTPNTDSDFFTKKFAKDSGLPKYTSEDSQFGMGYINPAFITAHP